MKIVQYRDDKEKTSLTDILSFLAKVNNEFAELCSPAFVFGECTWFTAGISLAQHSCADSAGPTIILSCFLANWLLQGSNSKTWKRNVLSNPSLLVPHPVCAGKSATVVPRGTMMLGSSLACRLWVFHVRELVWVLILLWCSQAPKLLTFQLSATVHTWLSVVLCFALNRILVVQQE